MRYKLPAAFIRDCIECDCDVGEYVNGHLYADADNPFAFFIVGVAISLAMAIMVFGLLTS